MKKRICLVLIFAFLLSGCGILQKRTEEVLSGFLTPEETLQTETVIFPIETQEKGKDKGEMTEPGEETAPPAQEVGIKVAAGRDHTVILYPDGTVAAVGNNDHGQCEVASWRDIVDISCGDRHTVGLRADGTVVCVGDNEENQCRTGNWTDVIAISAGDFHTVGLRSDGTLVATGWKVGTHYQVSSLEGGWKKNAVTAISSGYEHTVVLRADGTVAAAGLGHSVLKVLRHFDHAHVSAGLIGFRFCINCHMRSPFSFSAL